MDAIEESMHRKIVITIVRINETYVAFFRDGAREVLRWTILPAIEI